MFTEGKYTVCLISMLHSGSLEKRPRCSGWVRVHLWVFDEQQQQQQQGKVKCEERAHQWDLFSSRKRSYSIQFSFIYMASVARGALGKPRACPPSKNRLWRKEQTEVSHSHRQQIYWFTPLTHPVFQDFFLVYETFTAPDI